MGRDPHPAGRDPHPRGCQPGHQGEQASVKETSHTQRLQPVSLRMQGDCKEQHSSHSLNRWKERFDLWHRYAGMLTGSEPYKLRGILNKQLRSLMTRLGPSPEKGPGTQPTNSKWSFQFVHATSNIIMCSIKRRTNLWSWQCISIEFTVHICYVQWHKVFNREEDKSKIGAMRWAQYYTAFYQWYNKSVPIDRAMAQCYLCI